MALTFDKTELEGRIQQLPTINRAAFAAACAERMAPSYEAYSARSGNADFKVYNELLARLWTDLEGQRMSDAEIDANIERAEELVPPEDSSWVPEYPAADDAAAGLAYSFECRRNESAKEAVWAASRAYEAIDDYVITNENVDTAAPGAESEILSHRLVQAELARQSRDLDELREGRITINQLRDRAKAEATEFLPL